MTHPIGLSLNDLSPKEALLELDEAWVTAELEELELLDEQLLEDCEELLLRELEQELEQLELELEEESDEVAVKVPS